jgi:hypothetical protein
MCEPAEPPHTLAYECGMQQRKILQFNDKRHALLKICNNKNIFPE